jgi:hypothetical protein
VGSIAPEGHEPSPSSPQRGFETHFLSKNYRDSNRQRSDICPYVYRAFGRPAKIKSAGGMIGAGC